MKKIARRPSLPTPAERYDNYSFFCYGLNRLITRKDTPDLAATPPVLWDTKMNIASLGKASSVATLGDSVLRPDWDKAMQWVFFGFGNDGDGGLVHVRHSGRANLFFLDGHIESLAPKEIRALQTANPDIYDQGAFEYAEETIQPDGKALQKTIP